MMKKKTIKKIKAITKSVSRKGGVVMKKAKKEAGKVGQAIKKEWKREAPQRARYKKEISAAAQKAGAKGLAMLNTGLNHGLKIGGDVYETIRKDINEIRSAKKTKGK